MYKRQVYNGMTGRFGDYSGNTNLKVTDGDKTVKEWKSILVEEDPIYCSEHRADVEDFIKMCIRDRSDAYYSISGCYTYSSSCNGNI